MGNKRKMLVICALVISLVGSMVMTYLYSGHRLSFVVDSYAGLDRMYVVDDDGQKINIIATNPQGLISGRIVLDKIQGQTFTIVNYLNVDSSGVYIYKRQQDIISNVIISENVYLCDFDKSTLVLAWELPIRDPQDPLDQNNFAVKVDKGNLSFFSVETSSEAFEARAVLYSAGPNEKPHRAAVVSYDVGIGFNDFYLAENGTVVFTTPEGKIFHAKPAQKQPDLAAADDKSSQVPSSQNSVQDLRALPVMGGKISDEAVEEFGVEPAAIANSGESQTEFENSGLPEQKAPDMAAFLDRGMQNVTTDQKPTYDQSGALMLESTMLMQTRLANFTDDHKNTIYFMDIEKNGTSGIDLTDGSIKTIHNSLSSLMLDNGHYIEPYEIKNLRFTDENHFSASISNGANANSLAVFSDGIGKKYDHFTVSSGSMAFRGLLYFIGFILLFLLIYVAKEMFLIFTGGKVPIISKLIAGFVPVVIIGLLLLQNMLTVMFTKELIDNQYKQLFLVSRQQVATISSQLLADIDIKNPYDQVYYYNLRQLLNELPDESKLFDSHGQPAGTVYNFGYNWLFKVENNRLMTLYCDQNYLNIPIDYYYDQATTSMYYQAKNAGQTIQGSFRDMWGEWIVLAIPIVDDQQKVIAVMETGITKTAVEYAVAQNIKEINRMILGVMLVLILLLTGILFRSLAPLKQLKASIQDIINGRLGVQTMVRGNDEVADMSKVFNQMSASIEYHVNELSSLNKGYYKFVPSKMFQLLRKSSVNDVRLGDQMRDDIAILSFNAVEFEEFAGTMTGEEMFTLINRIFSNLVPVINHNGGVVDKFVNAGLIAFYTSGSERALASAVSVCQTMDQINDQKGLGFSRKIEMTNGLSFGPVMLGIVGHEERLAATTISEYTNLSGFLQKIAPKYCSRILTTASVIDQIEDFHNKFHARFIGFLQIQAHNRMEKIYDVFDGDQEEIKQYKTQTKELFEKGVNLYCAREFYEARLIFIEVLKKFRDDGAAKEYLFLCDRFYQLADKEGIAINIETY